MDRLKDFVLEEVLQFDATTKHTVLLGKIEEKPALIKLQRLALPEFEVGKPLPFTKLTTFDTNDVYSWGTGAFEEDQTLYLDVVWPATETHIKKYQDVPLRSLTETPELYRAVVEPYIRTQCGDRLDWVRGILFRGVEADRVLHKDEHFVLLPNSKWDRKTVSSLYLLVLVMREDLHSIRALTENDIPLLEHIRDTTSKLVEDRWGLDRSQLKFYFHYQPSYYHLHIHVANVGFEQNDFGKSILLDNIIDMLRVRPISEATLTYILAENRSPYPEIAALQGQSPKKHE